MTTKVTNNTMPHLNQKVKALLSLSDEERFKHINSPRWIGYPRAKQILGKLEELLNHPKQHRMPNLLIIGDTNNGKTMIVNRFRQLHPVDHNPEGETTIYPVMVVRAPPVPDEGRLYDQILRNLSAPFRQRDPASKKLFQVLTIFERVSLRILIIDEIHDILAGSLRLQHRFRNAIKHLGNELQIPIVGVGTHEAFHAVQTDSQLANRFEPILLPRWEIADSLKHNQSPFFQLLASFESMLPLKMPSNLAGDVNVALKIMGLSEGLIGEVSTILNKAAEHAIRTKEERIGIKTLDKIDFIPPAERKWKIK